MTARMLVTTATQKVCAIDRLIALANAWSNCMTNGWSADCAAAGACWTITWPKLWPTPVWLFRSMPWPDAIAWLNDAWNWATNGWKAGGASVAIDLNTTSVWAGSCSRRPDPNSVPAIASPTEPPIWRKNVRLLVATPSFENGTAFWTMIVNTDRLGPMPSPAMNIHSNRTGYSVSAVSWVIRLIPMTIPTRPVMTSAL